MAPAQILPEGCPAAVQSDPLPPGDRAPGGLRDAANRMLAALGEGMNSMSHQSRGGNDDAKERSWASLVMTTFRPTQC